MMDSASIAREMRAAVTEHEAQLEARARPQGPGVSDSKISQLLSDFARSIANATQNSSDPDGDRKAQAQKEFEGANHIVKAWIGANPELVRQVHDSMMSFPGMREALKSARPIESTIEEAMPHAQLKAFRDKKTSGAPLTELYKLLPDEQQQKFASMMKESR